MKITVCPNCNYKAKDEYDDLITKYNGKGECPKRGIIVQKFINKTNGYTSNNTSNNFSKKTNKHNNFELHDIDSNEIEENIFNNLTKLISRSEDNNLTLSYVSIIFISFLGYLIFNNIVIILIFAVLGIFISYFLNKNKSKYSISDNEISYLCLLPICIKLALLKNKINPDNKLLIDGLIESNCYNKDIFVEYEYTFDVSNDSYTVFDYAEILKHVLDNIKSSRSFRENLYEILFKIHSNDKEIHDSCSNILEEISKYFNLNKKSFLFFKEKYNKIITSNKYKELDKYYNILQCSVTSTLSDIKKAYRKRCMEFHPDKLSHKDIPAELLRYSNEQFILIKEAYDKLVYEHSK